MRVELTELRTGQEGMRVELTELRTGQEGMRVELTELRIGQTSIREELVKINYHLKLIDGKLKSAFGEIGDLRADFTVKMAEVENRLPKLEQP
jgi:hypothetical protein